MGAPSTGATRKIPQRSIASRIVRTGFVAVLVAGIGAGARFGYDYYEHGRSGETAATDTAAGPTDFLPHIGAGLPTVEAAPVSGRYVDVSLAVADGVLPDAAPTSTTRWQYSLVSQNLRLDYQGDVGAYELDVRDDQFLVRVPERQGWVDASEEPTITAVADGLAPLRGLVPMFHDVVPLEAIPYASVTAETDEQLSLVALDPPVEDIVPEPEAVVSDDPFAPIVEAPVPEPMVGLESAPRPTTSVPVRHYTLSLDEEAFAAAAPFVYAEWLSTGWWIDGDLDLWVDEFGVVRKMVTDTDTNTVTITIHDVADEFPDFQTGVLPIAISEDFGD